MLRCLLLISALYALPALACADDPCQVMARYLARGMEVLADASIPGGDEHDGMIVLRDLRLDDAQVAETRADLTKAGRPLIIGAVDPARTLALLQRATQHAAPGAGRIVVYAGMADGWPAARTAMQRVGAIPLFADTAIAPREPLDLNCSQ
ncbi:hypothetical protein [Chitiniphilus eburneus]|uniref:Rhodanese domain-containing protein n=1 Tax=Chitiniphilus eburneus TaxID=2571148 RepID=A0A4U0PZF9_9NEIS|nr:hypothetical protein [Chitiniphilus eburneus]TJZ74056.1 hypothetical protein FAZ21_08860 [Chitiniphilus eburneus]